MTVEGSASALYEADRGQGASPIPSPDHNNPDRRITMAETKPTLILDIETLNQISTQLDESADEITQVTLRDLAHRIRLAARCAQILARIRFALGEIAEKTKDHDTRLELRGLLDDAARAEPEVGQP